MPAPGLVSLKRKAMGIFIFPVAWWAKALSYPTIKQLPAVVSGFPAQRCISSRACVLPAVAGVLGWAHLCSWLGSRRQHHGCRGGCAGWSCWKGTWALNCWQKDELWWSEEGKEDECLGRAGQLWSGKVWSGWGWCVCCGSAWGTARDVPTPFLAIPRSPPSRSGGWSWAGPAPAGVVASIAPQAWRASTTAVQPGAALVWQMSLWASISCNLQLSLSFLGERCRGCLGTELAPGLYAVRWQFLRHTC